MIEGYLIKPNGLCGILKPRTSNIPVTPTLHYTYEILIKGKLMTVKTAEYKYGSENENESEETL